MSSNVVFYLSTLKIMTLLAVVFCIIFFLKYIIYGSFNCHYLRREYDSLNCHYLHSALNGGYYNVSHKTAMLYFVAAGYMAVPGPATRAKYDSHKRHLIPQITVVINKIFCSDSLIKTQAL